MKLVEDFAAIYVQKLLSHAKVSWICDLEIQ